MALAALPAHARPRPDQPDSPQLLVRTDSAGATHAFAKHLREAGCGFSMGFSVEAPVQTAVLAFPEQAWVKAHNVDGDERDGAWLVEITDQLDLSKWPTGSRVIVRRERPHPGAQIRFTDSDGHRFTAFITDTDGGQLPQLEVRHRSHARVEDRIRCGKSTGLRNMPCKSFAQNEVWLELCLTAADLITWSQALCFTGELATCEPATFRYRISAIAGRLIRSGRQWRLHLDKDWPGPTTRPPPSTVSAQRPGPPEPPQPAPHDHGLGHHPLRPRRSIDRPSTRRSPSHGPRTVRSTRTKIT